MKTIASKYSVFSTLKCFAKDCRGNVSVLVGLAAIPLFGAAGVAVDYSRAIFAVSELQTISDAAALAAASAANISGTTAEKIAQRKAIAENYLNLHLAKFEVGAVSGEPSVTVDNDGVDVAINASVTGSLVNVLFPDEEGGKNINVSVNASAAFGTDDLCLLSLDPTSPKAVEVNSDSSIIAPGCAIQVNSSSSEAIYANSGSIVTSEATCVVGNYKKNGGSTFTPTPDTGCAPLTDPLASLPVPAQASNSCTHTNLVVDTGQNPTLNPAVFCGGKLEVKNGATLTLKAGVHVFKDTEFIINSGGKVIAQDAMIYLSDSKGRMNFNSGSTIDLRAPSTGTYAGIAVFQSRTAVTDYHIVNSDSSSKIEGVVYVPNNALHINSGSSMGLNSPWWAVVAKRFQVNSDSTIHFNVNYDASSVPMPSALKGKDIRLTH